MCVCRAGTIPFVALNQINTFLPFLSLPTHRLIQFLTIGLLPPMFVEYSQIYIE